MRNRGLTDKEIELLSTFYVNDMHGEVDSEVLSEVSGEYSGLLAEIIGMNYSDDDKINHYLEYKEGIKNSISFAIDLNDGDVYIQLNYFREIKLEKQSYYEKGIDCFIIDADGGVELMNEMDIIKT